MHIRACHVIRRFSPLLGGTELQAERLSPTFLAANDVTVTVVGRAHPGVPRRESLPGGTVVRVKGPAGQTLRASPMFAPSAISYLARHRKYFDVVHVHDAHSAGTVALASRLMGLPTVVKITLTGPITAMAESERALPGDWQ